jgi:DNA-directed RNA polymerase subunit RPC12/RpoP
MKTEAQLKTINERRLAKKAKERELATALLAIEDAKLRAKNDAEKAANKLKTITSGRASKVLDEGLKIATIDIETTPIVSYTWGLFDQNVGVNQIAEEWTILSYAAKWLGEWKVEYADTGGRGAGKVRDDSELLEKLWHVLDKADIIIAQNGNSFDIKKINARLLMAGYGPYSPVRTIDTKIAAKQIAKFTSNRLEWLSEHLTDLPKSKHKNFPGFELWTEVMKDNPRAWKEMKMYNIKDSVATEKLYLKLRPWMKSHPNMSVYSTDGTQCAKCGSRKLKQDGTVTSQTSKFALYKCGECGGFNRSKRMLTSIDQRKSTLVGV